LTFNALRYIILAVIRTFKCKETEKIFSRRRSRKLLHDIQQVALRKLRMLNRVVTLNDLRVPPANRLEKLGEHGYDRGKAETSPEVLLEEFLKPMGLSQNRLALDIGVPARRINEIVLGKRRITADTALRLARYFGTSPQFWLELQMDYDLDVAADTMGSRLDREVRPHVVAS
jgi:addiction module HigA family antidote